MKLTFVLLTAFVLSASAKVSSQTITYSAKNVSLEQVFEHIETETGLVVFYDYSSVKAAQPVTVTATGMPLNRFLETILKPGHLHFTIVDKTIIISKDKKINPKAFLHAAPAVTVQVSFTLHGSVRDEQGEPLGSATVTDVTGKKSVMTDASGHFSIDNVQAGDVLLVSMVGYKARRVEIKNEREMTIVLEPAQNNLDSVVVVGYGTQKRSDITGAVASLDQKRLENLPNNNFLDAMEGAVPGLNIKTTGASAEDHEFSIQVR